MADLADTAEAKVTDNGKSKDSLKNILLFTLAAIVLIGITVGTTVFFLGNTPLGKGSEAGGEGAEQSEQKPLSPPEYLAIKPAFLVNFQNPKGARFLQVTVEVMSRQEKVIEAVKHHLPVIRNSLVFLFSSQDAAVISTREGKESLRQQVLVEIQKILEAQIGEPGVEDVYFTSFVMQ
jgi:flagellar FliL protein